MKVKEKVLFKPEKGKKMEAVVRAIMGNGTVELVIGSDPFPVTVLESQIETIGCEENGNDVVSNPKVRKVRARSKGHTQTMATTTEAKPSAKELRKQAQGLGIKGWEEMGRKALAKAIRRAEKAQNGSPAKAKPKTEATEDAPKPKAKKAKSKTAPASKPKSTKPKASKAPAKKTATKAKAAVKETKTNDGITLAKSHPKPTPEHGVNPFRKNSALFKVAKLLLKGGKRETLASKLSETVDLHPYQKAVKDVDLLDYDKRLLLGAQTMRDQYGYGILRTGRGVEGSILVFVPGGPTDPRGKGSKKSSKKK